MLSFLIKGESVACTADLPEVILEIADVIPGRVSTTPTRNLKRSVREASEDDLIGEDG
jgi:hypothetical protein